MDNFTRCFPAYFPEGCPPDNATDEEELLFRLCKTDIPAAEDFLTFYQISPEKYTGKILAYGLSVFPSEEDCDHARRKSPRLRLFQGIAYGRTDASKGKTLSTPTKNHPAHITWWIYEGVEPHTFFKGIKKGGGIHE